MAKLKAPLLSLGASGAIGRALVYFNWKGLDVVREYVIPSNPQTKPQTDHRALLTSIVKHIHLGEADTNRPLITIDKTAYSLLGSLFATPRTWFNAIVKQGLDQNVKGLPFYLWRGAEVIPDNHEVGISLYNAAINGASITTCYLNYGTSKSNLSSRKEADLNVPTHLASCTVRDLTNGVKYYFQFRPTEPDAAIGSNSGIYHSTPAA